MPTSKKNQVPEQPLSRKTNALPLTASMVKVVVGENSGTRDFVIHEALLTSRSEFFKKVMTGDWKEAEEKLVKLPEDDPDVFALYEQLIYTGRIPVFENKPETTEEEEKSDDNKMFCPRNDICKHEYELLAELYVLAEKLQDLEAKNTTIQPIIAKITHEDATVQNFYGPCLPGAVAIKTMWDKTLRHCAGRQIFLDIFVYYAEGYPINCMEQADILPREFLCDMVDNALTYRPQQTRSMPHEDIERYTEFDGVDFDDNMDNWNELACYRAN